MTPHAPKVTARQVLMTATLLCAALFGGVALALFPLHQALHSEAAMIVSASFVLVFGCDIFLPPSQEISTFPLLVMGALLGQMTIAQPWLVRDTDPIAGGTSLDIVTPLIWRTVSAFLGSTLGAMSALPIRRCRNRPRRTSEGLTVPEEDREQG